MTATAVRFDQDDLASLPDPYPALAALREHEPLHVKGDGSYLVTRYADVVALLDDPRAAAAEHRGGRFEPDAVGGAPFAHRLRPTVETMVDHLLDKAGDHHFDVVHDIAAPLHEHLALPRHWRGTRWPAADLVGNAVLALLNFPDEADRLRRDPSLACFAVDEVLRYDSPVLSVHRTAMVPIDLPDGVIEPGASIELSIAAANHDPRAFVVPDQLLISRLANPHLSFGLDRWRCEGAALVTLQCEVILTKLFERFSWIELDGFLVRKHQPDLHALASLPVRVIPR